MRMQWIALVLLWVLILSAVSAVVLLRPNLLSPPKFGLFYYVWYGHLADDWEPPKFVDYPVFGNYSSSDPDVIKQQLTSMEDAGIDFAVISWWGFYDDYGKYVDNATKQIFETAQAMSSTLKFAVMVEPFNDTGRSYDYRAIYNYIWNNYAAPYSSLYYNMSGKPVICFFNDGNLTRGNGNIPRDAKFKVVIVGQQSYTQWIYTDLNNYDFPANGPINQTSVTPRYDESHLSERPGNVTVDIYLNESIYDKEWGNAIQLWQEGKIDTIIISSWNEYPERTAIEPHYDGTSVIKDPFYLFNKTKSYTNDIKEQAAKGP